MCIRDRSHIAHDCLVEDNVILANNVPLGGHAHVERNVIIGGNSAVQQFTRVGKFAMIGGMCGVVRDVIPLVQIMSKNAKFAVEDRINIHGSFDGTVGEAVRAHKDYFMNETLTINMANEFKPSEYEDTFKVADVEVRLGIDRV